MTVSYQPKDKKGFIPSIRLVGLWLEQAGFKISDKISVLAEDGRIVITRVEV